MDYLQKSFSDGIDLIRADCHIADNGYAWLINAKQRLGDIKPNYKHIEITDVPEGNKQGLVAVEAIQIAFVAGYAYYRREDILGPWIQVPSFHMDEEVRRFWTIKVPASTLNFKRKLDVGLSIHAPINTIDFKIGGTPAGILVQDGINQPWIIEYDSTNQIFTSRVTKNFDEWENTSETTVDREYVPIGKQMMYKDGILHIVSADRKKVFRSITGRPLDFMINVDVSGNKAPTEAIGGAESTSYALDFDEITCLTEIDVADSFIYATAHNFRVVTADYNNTIFGEPLFRIAATIRGSGIVNQDSFVPSTNDFTFIALDGVKSFNAVQQLKFRGNNSIFSKQLEALFYNPTTKTRVKQVDCSATIFNNYLLFNLDTLWGNVIAVYDTLLDQWVSIDITEATRVVQFCIVETELETRLYCVTHFDQMFQMYADTENFEVAALRVRGFVPSATIMEHKSAHIRPFFHGGTFDGEVFMTEYVDDQLSVDPNTPLMTDYRYKNELRAAVGGITYPVIPPVMPNNVQRVDLPGFPITKGLSGKKLSFVIQWTNDASLVELELLTSEQAGQTSVKQKNIINELS